MPFFNMSLKENNNLIDCMFEAVRTNPGYGMATLIYNNLLNLIFGTIMFLGSS